MRIRKAELKDLSRIQELNNELFELEIANFDKYLIKDWPLSNEGKTYFENAIKESFVAVAEIDNKIVGYLLGEETDIPYYNFKIAELCNMCIDGNYRKQGIGNALYKEFESYFRMKGISHFVVTASFKNESAKAFYKKMGFEEANSTFVKF
ncbi:MAG: GNAT family N-acetyltransferase [Clostridiales bacterium]|nr:GNAT family N-acetyltransferase [Clostridiales bacterium]